VGKIAAEYDLMPESAEVDIQDIVNKIPGVLPDGVKFLDAKIQPIAFGLKKVVLGIVIDDSIESIGTILEEALSGLPGIDNIECVSSALL
jgi:elongation factor 1-beta